MISLDSSAVDIVYFGCWCPAQLFLFCEPLERFKLDQYCMSFATRSIITNHLKCGWSGWFIGNESPLEYMTTHNWCATVDCQRISTEPVSLTLYGGSGMKSYYMSVQGRVVLFNDTGFKAAYREQLLALPQRVHVAVKDIYQHNPDLDTLLDPLNARGDMSWGVQQITFPDTNYVDQIKVLCALMFTGFQTDS